MEKFTFSLFSHKTYKYFYFLLLYYLTTTTVNSMEIRLQESNKLIYDSNIVDGLFNFNPFRNKNNCSCDYTYTIGREQNSTIFTIFKNKNENFTVLNLNSNNDYVIIDYSINDYFYYQDEEISKQKNITISELIINHTCKSKKLGWSLINLLFETDLIGIDSSSNMTNSNLTDFITNIGSNKNNTLSLIKLCDEETQFSKIIPTVFITIMLLSTTHFATNNNLNFDSALRKFRNPKFTCLFLIITCICIFFSERLKNFVDKIIIGSFFIYIVTSIFCIYKRIKHAFIPVYLLRILNLRIFRDNRLKMSNVFLLLISALFYFSWYYTYYNWILTNFFVFCVISCMVHLFQIEQFFTIVIGIIAVIVTIALIIILEYFIDKNRVNPYELLINYPIQYEVPKFFWDDPRCLCIFADYVSIVLNIQILNYCKKIDRILYINKYYKKCFRLYFYYVTFLGVILILNQDNTEIFRNYLILFYPASALIMCGYSYVRREFNIFFRGKVLAGENLSAHNVIEIELEKEENVI